MVLVINLLSTIATAFVLSVIFHTLQLEGIVYFITYFLSFIYLSDKVSMHYINKYLSRKQATEMRKRIKFLIEEIEEDEDE